jgi:mRNA-degrading endonuclease YafQ of YafQ-DinJ toxin-antitoxin module
MKYNFKELKKEVISALKNSPRNYTPLGAHPLKGNMKGLWSISTGLNSNRDSVLFML